MGSIAILNVGAGDVKVTFDKNNPAETIRARRIIKDMLRRGYALLVEVERGGEKKFERALDFDESNDSYIVADFDPQIALDADTQDSYGLELRQEKPTYGEGQQAEAGSTDANTQGAKKGGRPRKAVPAEGTRAVAIARSAGG